MIKTIGIGIVVGNLMALNAVAYFGYRALNGGLNLLKSEVALQMEERLAEEYDYIKKDMKGLKENLLQSQEKLIPKGGTVKSGLPIF